MKVLVACEESQVVCKAFRALGHEAYSCDILPCSGGHPEWHLKCDVSRVLNPGTFRLEDGNIVSILNWDAIIAFPPCTHLAVSGAAWFEQKRKDGRQQQGIDFFMALANAPCDKVVIENPVGIMSSKWRKPDQIIQPYQFGDFFSKKTCLWIKGLPLLKFTKEVSPGEIVEYKSGKKMPKWYADAYRLPSKERAKLRSKTFPGVARAMAEQWGDYLLKQKEAKASGVETLRTPPTTEKSVGIRSEEFL